MTAADLMVAMFVHLEAAATEWAHPEEAAREEVLEATVVVAAADVEEDPVAAAMEEDPEAAMEEDLEAAMEAGVVAVAATVQAVAVVVESPRTSIHADDNRK